MAFCDFVPDDPSCATDPVVTDPDPPISGGDGDGDGDISGGDNGGDPGKGDGKDDPDMSGGDGKMAHEGKDWSMDDKKAMTWDEFDEKAGEYFHPMDANLAYLGVATGFVVDIVMRQFVWHPANSSTASQSASGTGNTDYYQLMHKIENFGGLGVWGLAALTQLLATMGIMAGINMMVWGYVVGYVGGLVNVAAMVVGYMAYDQFFKQSELATPNGTSAAYMALMEREMANHAASHIAGHFEMYHYAKDWVWGAYMNSSDEEKAAYREDKKFLMMLHLTPEMVEDMGMNGDKDMDMDKEGMKDMEKKMMDGPPALIMSFVNI